MGLISDIKAYVNDWGDNLERGMRRGFCGRNIDELTATSFGENFYLYKPWGAVFRLYAVYLVRFGLLTLLSAVGNVVSAFSIPGWCIALYECYIRLKGLERYNVSVAKSFIFLGICEIGFIFAAPHVNRWLWWLLTGLISGRFFHFS